MTDPSTAERLAALQARNRRARPPVSAAADQSPQPPTAPVAPADTEPTSVLSLGPANVLPATGLPSTGLPTDRRSGSDVLRFEMPWTRVATGGASVVSFAAMVVAMGPLLQQAETTTGASAADASSATSVVEPGAAIPVPPAVSIEVTAPPLVEPGQTRPDVGAAVTLAPVSAETAPVPAPASTAVAAPVTAAPTSTAPPATQPPATEPPATAPVTSAPPATATPTTAPAPAAAPTTTAPPTTAPPPTVAPTTVPPRTDGSG